MGIVPGTSTAQELVKYPRTRHIEGSRLQPGDEDLDQVPFTQLAGKHLVIEEKLDGANVGISFGPRGCMFLQSRGHFLAGGPRERHFGRLKGWAGVHQRALWEAIGDCYVLYGEWLAAKHTVFYDDLPHLLFEFDVLDRSTGRFLDTPSRRDLLAGAPTVPVPVLHIGEIADLNGLTGYVRPSLYKTAQWRARLADQAVTAGQDPARVAAETDSSDLAEGLYIKWEQNGYVQDRYKWVRPGFLNTILNPEGTPSSHWLDRPHIPNLLADGADLYAPTLTANMTALRPGQIA